MLIERSAQKQFLISTAESVKTELQYVKNAMSTTFNRTESSNFKIQIWLLTFDGIMQLLQAENDYTHFTVPL